MLVVVRLVEEVLGVVLVVPQEVGEGLEAEVVAVAAEVLVEVLVEGLVEVTVAVAEEEVVSVAVVAVVAEDLGGHKRNSIRLRLLCVLEPSVPSSACSQSLQQCRRIPSSVTTRLCQIPRTGLP